MTWNIAGKQVLVTGGNSGIGKATAEELARRGAQVMITARDATKGQAAAADIHRSTGVEVEIGDLDLSRLESVREFADTYVDEHDRLDILINNAGAMAGARQETPDGFEWTFGVNHLGPFLLTNLLTDLLVTSSPARIINVSSGAHRSAKNGLDFQDLQMTQGYASSKAYSASKLANILFTVELDRRLRPSGVTVNALHPGVVATSFGTGQEGPKWMGVLMTLGKYVFRKPSRGAETSVFLASTDSDSLDGGIYWSDCEPEEPIAAATDSSDAAELWTLSEKLVSPQH